ncbi:MAG TPA: prepilin-type N-terminal cleavage/methylation domain-containing protein [Candidatus Saccharimonadales bacterium]|nr:prepilin-type N-terminal cleavage/methylation domain-containing protein [Candidatus Saccharimonadales bacterium]
MSKLNRKQQGFTIIEVMIVLAIAAVILLAVFLAVPQLQRNSRNQQRKTDVANILAGVNEYASNQNGTLPTQVCVSGNVVSIGGGAACGSITSKVDVNVSGQFTTYSIAAYAAGQTTAANTVKIYTAATCNGNALASGSGRSVAAFYQIEPATDQCQAS